MVTQYDVENKVVEYVVQKGHYPRYVLLDSKSYEEFNKLFIPKERIDVATVDVDVSIKKMHVVGGCIVDILQVHSDKPLFEIVG